MAVRVSPFNDYTHPLDGGEIRFKLTRMTAPQFAEFNAMFQAWSNGRGSPTPPAGDAPESLDEVRASVAVDVAYKSASAAWIAETFKSYVHVVEGDMIHERADGSDEVVTAGDRFAELYQADVPVVLAELFLQNAMTGEQKKILQLQRASGTGLTTASSQEAPGPRPETAATPADSEDSAAAAAAMAPSSDTLSGSMDPLFSELALSAS